MGNAAAGAGLARLMAGDTEDAREWFARAVERYRESYELAPPESWGRPIAILKARILGDDLNGGKLDALWTLEQDAAEAESSIGRYAAVLALLVLGRDGDALAFVAAQDPLGYVEAVEAVLESFETREDYLEDLPVAETVIVLQALAGRRNMQAELSSPLLP